MDRVTARARRTKPLRGPFRRSEGNLVIDSGTAGIVVSAGDLATTRTLAALDRQAAGLERVRARMQDAIVIAPASAESDWRGPAQRLYELGLVDLRLALAAVSLRLDDALAETRRATATISSRVG